MKRKILASMMIPLLIAGGSVVNSYAAGEKNSVLLLNIDKPTMLVNGTVTKIDSENDVAPVLQDDTTMVPIRAIIESLGGKVLWDENEKKATISYNNKVVELWLDKNTANVNGTEVNIKKAPTTINNRTMLPLRFVSENLGLYVNWEDSSKAISLTTSNDYIAVAGGIQVNSTEYNIYLGNAKTDVTNYISQYQMQTTEKSIWDVQINGMKAGDLVKQIALENAVRHKALLAKANENNVTLGSEDLKSIDDSMAEMIKKEGDQAAAEKTIKSYYNVGLAEYTSFFKENKLINKYLIESSKKVEIPVEDINNAYEKNKQNYSETVTVRHILISTVDSQGKEISKEKLDEAKKKAEDVLAKVKAGEDFAALAKQYSEDPGSKDNAGEYTFPKGQMVKEFEDWSFNAKDGDTGLIKTSFGYHVMKFIKRSTVEDTKNTIREGLVNEKMNAFIEQIFNDTKNITVKNQSAIDAIEVK